VTSHRADLSRVAAEVVRRFTAASEPTRATRLRGGVMNDKYLVTSSDAERYVVRFYSKPNAAALFYEPDLVKALREEGLPVAKVVGDSRSGPGAPLPYMVYEYLPGRTLRSQLSAAAIPVRRRVACQLAEVLSSLGSLRVTGFGDLLDAQTGRYEDWAEFMEASLTDGISNAARHGSLPVDVIRHVDLIRAHLECFAPPARPQLAWGDILTNNVLVDNGHLSGVVDFEGTLAADYALNLGYVRAAYGLSAQFGRYLFEASEAKLQPDDFDRVNLYAVLRGVRVAGFAHLPLPTGLRRRPVLSVFPGVRPAARILADRLKN
jgi:aminoglycoside phosphotransferase (APT) family kinase protein